MPSTIYNNDTVIATDWLIVHDAAIFLIGILSVKIFLADILAVDITNPFSILLSANYVQLWKTVLMIYSIKRHLIRIVNPKNFFIGSV